MSQAEIDELSAQYAVADVLPLTPLQRGLLFQSAFAEGSDDDVYAVQLGLTVTGDLDTDRLREAVHAVVGRHPNGGTVRRAVRRAGSGLPVDPQIAWRQVAFDTDVEQRVEQLCAAGGPRSAISPSSPRSGRR